MGRYGRAALPAAALAAALAALPAAALAAPGRLDPVFGGGDGRFVSPRARPGQAVTPSDLALQADGRIVVVGSTGALQAGTLEGVVLRFGAKGSPDPSFGAAGRVQSTFGATGVGLTSVAPAPDGRIVVVGDGGHRRPLLARLLPDGSFDPGFGVGGVVRTAPPTLVLPTDVAVLPDGRIVVVGIGEVGARNVFAAARYLPDGSLDASFGAGGGTTVAIGEHDSYAREMAVFADGRLAIVGGAARTPRKPSGEDADFVDYATVVLAPDGSVDEGFGRRVTRLGREGGEASSVAIQPDGKVVVAGGLYRVVRGARSGVRLALVRYSRDGALDRSFGEGGQSLSPLESSATRGIALQPDGKLLVGGDLRQSLAASRLNPDGSPDQSYGSVGQAVAPLGEVDSQVFGSALQPDGALVVGAHYFVGESEGFGLMRFQGGADEPPPPVLASSVVATPAGSVRLKLPPARDRPVFPALAPGVASLAVAAPANVPVRSELDTARGRVTLNAARRGTGLASSTFFGGAFRLGQVRRGDTTPELRLVGGSRRACGRARGSRGRAVRRLWGSGDGRYRTRGTYSSAVVRGTTWLTEDRCDGTLTRVTEGRVAVRDLVRRRTVVVRAGQRYLARRR